MVGWLVELDWIGHACGGILVWMAGVRLVCIYW